MQWGDCLQNSKYRELNAIESNAYSKNKIEDAPAPNFSVPEVNIRWWYGFHLFGARDKLLT